MAEKKSSTPTSKSAENKTLESKVSAVASSAVGKVAASNFVVLCMLLLIVGLSVTTGNLWARVKYGAGTAPLNGAGNPQAGAPTEVNYEELAKNLPEVGEGDHIMGNPNAEVFLVEYSDFQCPFCERFHPTAKQVLDAYGDKVAWVYRHFPLDSIHPLARKMAIASECVAEQGGEEAFWAFGEALFANKPASEDAIAPVAAELGLDPASVQTCMDSETYVDKVQEQYQGGVAAGVDGTPGNFVVNSKTGAIKVLKGAVPFEQVKSTINQVLTAE